MQELSQAVVFEVDHPAPQQDKQRRAGGLDAVAGRVVPVPVDPSTGP
jgi:O-methyltransferase involved in polyketide biosynthesis